MNNRLVIGTAQFGSNYGIHNLTGKVEYNKIKAILNKAYKNGINSLDTAVAYNKVHKNLGALGIQKWNIYSKIPSIPKNTKDIDSWLMSTFEKTLNELQVKSIEGLYFHNPKQLLGKRGEKIYKAVSLLKEESKIKKIGFSVYSPSELDSLWSIYKPDIIQLPYNLFDRRFKDTNWLPKLKKNKVEIHARSIFLQGLVFFNKKNLPSKFKRYKAVWDEYEEWLFDQKVNQYQGALTFALSNKDISKFVIGIDNIKQLIQLINFKVPKIELPEFTSYLDSKLLEPSKWNKL